MQNMKKYKETLDFCDSVQHKKDIQGWTTLKEFNYFSKNKAFDAKVYKQNNRIVIAFAGSETPNDYYNDAVILGGYIPSQYYEAEKLYNNVKAKYANSNIETVGYSLGGTISNLLSHRTGIPSNAVAPIGSMHIVQKNKDYFPYSDSNITTYGRLGDVLFSQNLTKQSGNIYIVPDLPNEQVEKRLPKVENHYLHNFTPYNLY